MSAKGKKGLLLMLSPAVKDDLEIVARIEGVNVTHYLTTLIKRTIDDYKREREIGLDTTLRAHYIMSGASYVDLELQKCDS